MLPVSVLKHRAFKNLFIGQSISQLGDALYYVVFMYMVKRLTGSDAMVGFVGAVEAAPFVLFSGYAGVLADRIDRRKIMLASDWLCAGILAIFGIVVLLSARIPVEVVFAVAFLTSVFRVFFMPAKNASIPNLVPLEDTLEANTLNAMSFNLFFALGLSISTLTLSALFALSSQLFFGLTVLLNALSFAVSAFFIAKLPPVIPDRKEEEPHPLKDFTEGVKYIWRRRVLTVLMVAGLFMSLAIAPFFVTYVAANDAWFGGQPHTLTMCELSFFVGMIVGSAVLARLKFKRVGLGYVMGLGVTGFFVAVMAGTPILWAFCLLNFLCGLFIPFADIPVQSYVQMKVEDAFRGRVNSALMMLRMGMMPVGMALGGVVIGGVGLIGMFLTMGIGMMVVAGAALLDPAFRASTLAEEPTVEAPEDPMLSEAVA